MTQVMAGIIQVALEQTNRKISIYSHMYICISYSAQSCVYTFMHVFCSVSEMTPSYDLDVSTTVIMMMPTMGKAVKCMQCVKSDTLCGWSWYNIAS